MKTDPADPHDIRHATEPIIETMEIAMDGAGLKAHAHKIESALKDFPGVRTVKSDLDEAIAHVTYDARQTNPAAIHDAILESGYHPSGIAD